MDGGPIQARNLAYARNFKDVAWDSDGKTVVWLENRGVLVCSRPPQPTRDLNDLSVRAQVGYGGGDFSVTAGAVFFVEARSGRIYRQDLDSDSPVALTPETGSAASPCLSANHRWLAYIHSDGEIDTLCVVDAHGEITPRPLASGADFYMQPSWHPRREALAWVEWNHPHMPWDDSRLMLGHLEPNSGIPSLASATSLAGGNRTAVFQPAFSPDGRYLAYVSDVLGWSNLWLYDLDAETHRPRKACCRSRASRVGPGHEGGKLRCRWPNALLHPTGGWTSTALVLRCRRRRT